MEGCVLSLRIVHIIFLYRRILDVYVSHPAETSYAVCCFSQENNKRPTHSWLSDDSIIKSNPKKNAKSKNQEQTLPFVLLLGFRGLCLKKLRSRRRSWGIVSTGSIRVIADVRPVF